MKAVLIDTGCIIASLNDRDPYYGAIARVFTDFHGEMHTTMAVVTEAMQMLRKLPNGPERVLRWLEHSQTHIHGFTDLADLANCVSLMNKYASSPMDFADATLVVLAERVHSTDVITVDQRGFTVFRTSAGKRFTLFPSPN